MSKEFNGFEEQDDETVCGPYSISHALLLLGQPTRIESVKRNVRPNRNQSMSGFERFLEAPSFENIKSIFESEDDNDGTSPEQIMEALRKFSFKYRVIQSFDKLEGKKQLDRELQNGYPVITCVDGGSHWNVVAGKLGERYAVIDSYYDRFSSFTWPELINEDKGGWNSRCDNCDEDEDDEYDGDRDFGEIWCDRCKGWGVIGGNFPKQRLNCPRCKGTGVLPCPVCNGMSVDYYGIVVIPKDPQNPSCVRNLGKFYKKIVDDGDLQEYWGVFLADLYKVFGPEDGIDFPVIPASEWFRTNRTSIVSSMEYWYADFTKDEIEAVFDYYAAVAEGYDLKCVDSKETLLNFVICLGASLLDQYYSEDE